MVNYRNGKIYRLENADGLVYIGSTTENLKSRKAKHKYQAKFDVGTTTAKLLYDNSDDVEIYLIEKYPCNGIEELEARERYWIENTNCVNKNIPGRTKKEYYLATREQRIAYLKEYYEKNKSVLREKQKEYAEQHREEAKQRANLWYSNNKDRVGEYRKLNKAKKDEYMKEYRQIIIECECGSIIKNSAKSNHERSNKHINSLVDKMFR